jgi:hypothetical protein
MRRRCAAVDWWVGQGEVDLDTNRGGICDMDGADLVIDDFGSVDRGTLVPPAVTRC